MNRNSIFIINFIISILIIFSLFNSINALEFKVNEINTKNNVLQNPIYLNSKVNESRYKIIYPLSTNPALVEKYSNFIINFEAKEFEEIYVIISTAYEAVTDEIVLEYFDFILKYRGL